MVPGLQLMEGYTVRLITYFQIKGDHQVYSMSDFLMVAVCDADLMAENVGERLVSKLVCSKIV
jgi:hypothetical protein